MMKKKNCCEKKEIIKKYKNLVISLKIKEESKKNIYLVKKHWHVNYCIVDTKIA